MQPQESVLACAELLREDLLEEWIPTDPTDKKFMRDRLFGKHLITGLRIIDMTLHDKNEFPLIVNERLRNTTGWMGSMTIRQSLPGFVTPIEASFDYVALIYKNSHRTTFRTGPYNAQTLQIGEINNPELQEARKRSRTIGAGSLAVVVTKKKAKSSTLQNPADQ